MDMQIKVDDFVEVFDKENRKVDQGWLKYSSKYNFVVDTITDATCPPIEEVFDARLYNIKKQESPEEKAQRQQDECVAQMSADLNDFISSNIVCGITAQQGG